MAFETLTPLISYPADGVITEFAVPDKFYDASDVKLFYVDADGQESQFEVGTDYSVVITATDPTPPARKSGKAVFVTPPPAGGFVVPFIWPDVDQDQPFEGRPVTPRQNERVHDRHAMRDAALRELLFRGFRSPLSAAPGLRYIEVGAAGRVPVYADDGSGSLVEGPSAADLLQAQEIAEQAAAIAQAAADYIAQFSDELTTLPTLLPLTIAAKDAAVAAAQASGNVRFFDTYALANAALAGLPADQVVEVFFDENRSGLRTRYRKESGVLVLKIIFGDVETIATDFALYSLPTVRRSVRTSGYYAAGDGGGALYKRVVAQPAHSGKLQSADGTWWELAEDRPTFEMFGAKGDGVTDDSAAISNALAGTWRRVIALPKIYMAKNIIPAAGVLIEGFAGHGYTTVEAQVRPVIRKMATAGGAVPICIFNVTDKRSLSLHNLVLDGVDKTVPCISGGSTRLDLLHCNIINGSFGVGGSVGVGGDAYTRTIKATNCVITTCVVGMGDTIDGFFMGVELANNDRNLVCGAGSNSNTWLGGRIEWAQVSHNIQLFGCSAWEFMGLLIDSGMGVGANLKSCSNIKFTASTHKRAGRADSGATEADCHFFIEACNDIFFNGINTIKGVDDGAASAAGSIVFTANPTIGDTITLNGVVFTAAASARKNTNLFKVEANLATTLASLVVQLNDFVDYAVSYAAYSVTGGNTLTISGSGADSNSFTLASSSANGVVSGATLSGGATVLRPKYIVRFGGSPTSNRTIIFTNCNLTGSKVGVYGPGGIRPTDLKINNCKGANDLESVSYPKKLNGRVFKDRFTTASLAAGASEIVSFANPVSLGASSRTNGELNVIVRDSGNSNPYAAKFNLLFSRPSAGSPTIVASAAFGEIGTAGWIGVGGGTGIQLTIDNIAADASTFDITVLNTTASRTLFTTLEFV